MAFIATPNNWFGLAYAFNPIAGISTSTTTINSGTVSAAFLFQPGTTDAITHLGFRKGTSAGGSGTTGRISLQGVTSGGQPDGSIKSGGSANATFLFNAPTTTAFNWFSLTSSYTPSSSDELLCYVIEYLSGTTPDGSHNLGVVGTCMLSATTRANRLPCFASGSGGTYTQTGGTPVWGFRTASGRYGFPLVASGATTINSGGTPEAGGKFRFMNGFTGKYKVGAVRVFNSTMSAASTITAKLYGGGGAGDTTALQTGTVDTDAPSSGGAGGVLTIPLAGTPAELDFGSYYRVALSTGDANNQIVHGFTVTDAADLEAFGHGSQMTLSTRNGGNWTDTDTTRLLMEVRVDSVQISGGGGARVIGG
jgi:hypothetical protein